MEFTEEQKRNWFNISSYMVLFELYKQGLYRKFMLKCPHSKMLEQSLDSVFNMVKKEHNAMRRDGSKFEFIMFAVNGTLRYLCEPFFNENNIEIDCMKFGQSIFHTTILMLFGVEGINEMNGLTSNHPPMIDQSEFERFKSVVIKNTMFDQEPPIFNEFPEFYSEDEDDDEEPW